jgi:hypothetical protein
MGAQDLRARRNADAEEPHADGLAGLAAVVDQLQVGAGAVHAARLALLGVVIARRDADIQRHRLRRRAD